MKRRRRRERIRFRGSGRCGEGGMGRLWTVEAGDSARRTSGGEDWVRVRRSLAVGWLMKGRERDRERVWI
jgi:hypothetical protein